ncbi:Hypothetical predicted protein [Pelobates cultripes]|nr:Hypothetical predicted protein [Pelobates cultripes]
MYDVLEALNMDDMMTTVNSWTKHSKDAETTRQNQNEIPRKSEDGVYFLIIEGFLLYSYMPLDNVFNKKYFLTIPYEECKKRRSTRVYEPPDPPDYFDGHVWPMYLKHKDQMEKAERGIVYLDGTKLEDDIYSFVYADIRKAGLHWGSWCQARSVSLAGIPLCCNWALLQLTGRCEERQHPTAPHSGSQPIPQILNPGLLGGT